MEIDATGRRRLRDLRTRYATTPHTSSNTTRAPKAIKTTTVTENTGEDESRAAVDEAIDADPWVVDDDSEYVKENAVDKGEDKLDPVAVAEVEEPCLVVSTIELLRSCMVVRVVEEIPCLVVNAFVSLRFCVVVCVGDSSDAVVGALVVTGVDRVDLRTIASLQKSVISTIAKLHVAGPNGEARSTTTVLFVNSTVPYKLSSPARSISVVPPNQPKRPSGKANDESALTAKANDAVSPSTLKFELTLINCIFTLLGSNEMRYKEKFKKREPASFLTWNKYFFDGCLCTFTAPAELGDRAGNITSLAIGR